MAMGAIRVNSWGRLLIFTTTGTFLISLWFMFFSGPHYQQIPNYGTVKPSQLSSGVAIATFLSGTQDHHSPPEDDFYYTSARILTYQLLHDPLTKNNGTEIPFLVLCTKEVTAFKREQLKSDGAEVVIVNDVPLPRWISTGVTRWKDQFTKLRVWEMTQYSRVLFLDADTLLTSPIDGIFNELIITTPMTTLFTRSSQVKSDEKPLPESYIFAARSDNALTGERNHPFPPPPTEVFSAGFWIAAPSKEMFEYFMSVMERWRRFHPHTMEQSLLNYVFRREGAMPWFELGYEWSATWPNERDWRGGVRSLHEKFEWEGPRELQALWKETTARMLEFYGNAKRT